VAPSTSDVELVLGDSGGFETAGYTSYAGELTDVGSALISEGYSTAEFMIVDGASSTGFHGSVTLVLNDASDTWCISGVMGEGTAAGAVAHYICSGSKSLSGTLTQIRLQNSLGTNFAGGTVNILIEG
ncbi:MAG: hypothetical protein KJN90_01285, partial [Gammaproteobacteria bacterium]|nr:hypothetical protein [Gammaproteobacteria bacterium]